MAILSLLGGVHVGTAVCGAGQWRSVASGIGLVDRRTRDAMVGWGGVGTRDFGAGGTLGVVVVAAVEGLSGMGCGITACVEELRGGGRG